MLISEVINSLEKIKEKFGDQKLFMWVNSNDDTLFPVNFPELDIIEISGEDYGIDEKWLNQNEKILIIKNLDKQGDPTFRLLKSSVKYILTYFYSNRDYRQ